MLHHQAKAPVSLAFSILSSTLARPDTLAGQIRYELLSLITGLITNPTIAKIEALEYVDKVPGIVGMLSRRMYVILV